jgi:predicted regulator of Ras-like GTPase activity (Roadblock/LC7/MglB family)
MEQLFDSLRGNELSTLLDEFRIRYAKLSREGRIFGLIIADQDAKVIAVNTFYDDSINHWDMGALGAALYGIAKQGQSYFRATDLDRANLVYGNRQIFVHNVGNVQLTNGKQREVILIVIGDRQTNFGLIVMQMRQYAPKIKSYIEQNEQVQASLDMTEQEFARFMQQVKHDLFQIEAVPHGSGS